MADFGVYVHIPFCSVRCDYCAFATWTEREHLIDDYLAALRVDVQHQVARLLVELAHFIVKRDH